MSNIEQFGQYPLQVNGFNNLDECLEGAMVEGEIESLHSDQTMSSGQEVSFSTLTAFNYTPVIYSDVYINIYAISRLCIQAIYSFFLALGIKPMTLVLLAPFSYVWAKEGLKISRYYNENRIRILL